MSSNLVWQVVRNNSSFLVKNSKHDGAVLTKEPLNLTQKNSFKYSGLASRSPVGLTKGEKGGVVLTTATKANQNKPAKRLVSVTLNRDARRSARSITNTLNAGKYRPDLKSAALKRLSALTRKPAPEPRKRPARGGKK